MGTRFVFAVLEKKYLVVKRKLQGSFERLMNGEALVGVPKIANIKYDGLDKSVWKKIFWVLETTLWVKEVIPMSDRFAKIRIWAKRLLRKGGDKVQ